MRRTPPASTTRSCPANNPRRMAVTAVTAIPFAEPAARASAKFIHVAGSMENRSFIQNFIARAEFGPLVLLMVELVVFWGINPDFLSPQNISNILAFTVELGLIALAMTLLMTSGEFDLSVGSLFGFSPVLMWTLFNGGVTSLEVGFVIALVVAGFIGFANGW